MPSRAQDLFATTFEQEREMRSKLTNPIAALIEQDREMRSIIAEQDWEKLSKLTTPIAAIIEEHREKLSIAAEQDRAMRSIIAEQDWEKLSKLTNPIAALIEQERTMRSKLTAPIEALIEQGQETPHRFSVVRHPLAPGYVGLESTVKSWWFSSKAWPVAEDPTAVGSITYVHNHYHHYYYCSSVNVHGDNVGAIRIDHGANADTTDRPR